MEWSVYHSTEDQLNNLMMYVHEAENIIKDGRDHLELGEYDLKFHLCLAEMSNNEVAYRTMNYLIDLLAHE